MDMIELNQQGQNQNIPTPLTDAWKTQLGWCNCDAYKKLMPFARNLERQLHLAKAEVVELNQKLSMTPHELFAGVCRERDVLQEKYDTLQSRNEKVEESQKELLAICIDFVAKCDRGEARSRRTYAAMKQAIITARKLIEGKE